MRVCARYAVQTRRDRVIGSIVRDIVPSIRQNRSRIADTSQTRIVLTIPDVAPEGIMLHSFLYLCPPRGDEAEMLKQIRYISSSLRPLGM